MNSEWGMRPFIGTRIREENYDIGGVQFRFDMMVQNPRKRAIRAAVWLLASDPGLINTTRSFIFPSLLFFKSLEQSEQRWELQFFLDLLISFFFNRSTARFHLFIFHFNDGKQGFSENPFLLLFLLLECVFMLTVRGAPLLLLYFDGFMVRGTSYVRI